MTGQDESEGFLGRWARRKQEAKAEPAATPPPSLEPESPSEDDLAAKFATLPKIEDVTAATDIKVFLESWVPDALRNAALRKVWATDPHISTFIETADYQWDWTVPGGAPGSGPLEVGFDAQRFIAEMFENRAGSKPVDNAVRDAESQPAAPSGLTSDIALQQAASNDAPAAEAALRKTPDGTENTADLSMNEPDQLKHGNTAAQQSSEQNHAELAPKRRRHGGALPILGQK